MIGTIIKVLGLLLKLFEDLQVKLTKKKIEGAVKESDDKKDQRSIEALTGDSGKPSDHEYSGMRIQDRKSRR